MLKKYLFQSLLQRQGYYGCDNKLGNFKFPVAMEGKDGCLKLFNVSHFVLNNAPDPDAELQCPPPPISLLILSLPFPISPQLFLKCARHSPTSGPSLLLFSLLRCLFLEICTDYSFTFFWSLLRSDLPSEVSCHPT